MNRLESGESGGVIVFDMERFSRRPTEGERLITAAEHGLVVLDSDGEFDLTTSSGKKAFRDAMTAAAYYSDRLSDRVTRGKKQKALLGEPNGCRPFGFLPDGVTPHPEESVILREVATRLLAGEAQGAIMADLDARGIRTVRGGRWSRAGLRMMLTRPRNAGYVTYQSKVVAKLPGEPILSDDEYERLLALYAARRPGRPPSGVYLCAGVITCAACGKPMAGRPRYDRHYPDGEIRREYLCNPTGGYDGCGKTAIDQRSLDEYAKELAIEILSDAESARAAEVAAAEVQAEAGELDKQIAQAEELAIQLSERLGQDPKFTIERYNAVIGPLDKRIEKLRSEREALGTAPSPIPVDTEAAWRKTWANAEPDERRALLKLALKGSHILVRPAGRPEHRADIAARVTVTRP